MAPLSRIGLGSFFAIALGVAPALADVTFTDTTFNAGNYSSSPGFSSDPSASISDSGFGSGTLTFTSTFTNASAPGTPTVAVGLVNLTFAINPTTQGAITSIDASVIKNLSVTFAGSGFGNTFRPTIKQDGIFYLAAIPGPALTAGAGGGSTGFNTLSALGLTATSFLSYNFSTGAFGTANPNFDGDPMLFGLTQITGVSGTAGIVTAQYRDLSFDIHGVPEPSTIALLGAGLLGFGWLYRRKNA